MPIDNHSGSDFAAGTSKLNQNDRNTAKTQDQAIKAVELYRISDTESADGKTQDKVIVERPVTIMVNGVGSFTILCTPTDVKALAVGFVFTEGIISSMDDVISISSDPTIPDVIAIVTEDQSVTSTNRNLVVTSSCGLCGVRNIEELLARANQCDDSLKIPRDTLTVVLENMESMQHVFSQTGGAHAAGIFTVDGEIVAFAEDIGRHNTMDKAIGKCIIEGRPTGGCGIVLSGRVSFEMVAKAARAGIGLILAVSAPSSLAIEAADKLNVTICGFARAGRANVYTHPERICDLQRDPS